MSAKPYEAQADAAWKWWTSLQPGEHRRADRATLAKLKRSSGLMEAASEPATADLFKKLGFDKNKAGIELPRAALIAAVLAHVRADLNVETLARSIGTPRGGDDTTALVTQLRLKRLIAARELDDLLIAFRRVIAILGQTANVKDVARQLLLWTDEHHADRARTVFAFAYHSADQFAPDLKPD